MPGTNLTRDEARTRAGVVSDVSYTIELDLTAAPSGAPTFPSVTTVTFAAEAGASTFADLIADKIREVTLNGRALDPDTVYDGARIQLDGLAERNELRVVADCLYSRTGEGLHRSVDPADKETYLYTQFEVPDARRVFTTFEQPDLKAPFTFTGNSFANSATDPATAATSVASDSAGETLFGHTVHFEPTGPNTPLLKDAQGNELYPGPGDNAFLDRPANCVAQTVPSKPAGTCSGTSRWRISRSKLCATLHRPRSERSTAVSRASRISSSPCSGCRRC